MNGKKRIVRLALILLSVAVLLASLTACRKEDEKDKKKQEDERYTATATVWIVGSSGEGSTSMPAGDAEVMNALVNDCTVLMTADRVLEEVIVRCESSRKVEELHDIVRISNEKGSRVLSVSVLSLDADEACLLVNTLVDVGCEHIKEVCGDPVARIWAYAESAT